MGIIQNSSSSSLATNYGFSVATTLLGGALGVEGPVFVDAAGTDVLLMWTGMSLSEGLDKTTGMARLSKFPDDRNAIEIDPVKPIGTARTFKGAMMSWDEVEAVRISISVLPGTADEKALAQLVIDQDSALHANGNSVALGINRWNLRLCLSQKAVDKYSVLGLMPSMKKFMTTFSNGRVVEVVAGYGDRSNRSSNSIVGDRKSSNRYVFEFATWKPDAVSAGLLSASTLVNVATSVARGVL